MYINQDLLYIIFGRLMLLTIVCVCAKFHKNRLNNKKKVMTVQCPYITMFVDLENFRPLWVREHGAGEGSIGASLRGQEAPGMG